MDNDEDDFLNDDERSDDGDSLLGNEQEAHRMDQSSNSSDSFMNMEAQDGPQPENDGNHHGEFQGHGDARAHNNRDFGTSEEDFETSEEGSHASPGNSFLQSDHNGESLESGSDDFLNRENDIPFVEDQDRLIYEGESITVAESNMAIFQYMLRHNLPLAALDSTLALLQLHLPEINLCTKTRYMFEKFFRSVNNTIVKHYLCYPCGAYLGLESEVCPQCFVRSETYFIECPLEEQLIKLHQRPEILKLLREFHQQEPPDPNIRGDITTGTVYRELSAPGQILSNPNNCSFFWYTDDVNVFESSKYGLTPVYFVVNELPYKERVKKENMLIGGYWFGEQKPLMQMFFNAMVPDLLKLNDGINIKVPEENEPRFVQAIVIGGNADLPAKAKSLNMKQHNGFHGCPVCEQVGHHEDGVHLYPYQPFHERTQEDCERYAAEAAELDDEDADIMGLRAPTALSRVVYQCYRTAGADVMHQGFSGVFKKLLEILLTQSYSTHAASLFRFLHRIDDRIINLKLPAFAERVQRDFSTNSGYLKANEYKTCFFHYAVPIFEGIMDQEFFNHLKLLVCGISMLCRSTITLEEIDQAEEILRVYVEEFERLYGVEHMTINVHMLLHFAKKVRELGALWATSCFPYEDVNGQLVKYVKSSNAPQLQIHKSLTKFRNFAAMYGSKLTPGTPAREFCDKIDSKNQRLSVTYVLGNSTYILGVVKRVNAGVDFELRELLERLELLVEDGSQVWTFTRLLKEKYLYYSRAYTRLVMGCILILC